MRNALADVLRKSSLYPLAKAVQERTPARVAARRQRQAFYSQFVSRDALVFDIGANVGNRVETFLKLGARVVAVEPQSMCVRMLKSRFGRNERLTVIPYGLDAQQGEQQLYVADDHVLSSMSPEMVARPVVAGTEWKPPIAVPVTTFDALIDVFGVPSFTKVDVEGFEPQVLAGLSRAVPALSLEYHPEATDRAHACLDRLTELGAYEFAFSPGESMALTSDGWLMAGELRDLLRNSSWGDIYARLAPASVFHAAVSKPIATPPHLL